MFRRNLFCTEPGGKQAADVHRPQFFPRREHRCRPGLSQAWLRRFNSAFVSRSLRTATRVANFDSEVPALNRRELGAIPRQPTISASVVKLLSSSAWNREYAGKRISRIIDLTWGRATTPSRFDYRLLTD